MGNNKSNSLIMSKGALISVCRLKVTSQNFSPQGFQKTKQITKV